MSQNDGALIDAEPIADIAAAENTNGNGGGNDKQFGAKVARGVRWSIADIVLQDAMRFAINVVITRLVLPDERSVLAMAFVVTALAAIIGDFGLGPALVQRKELTRKHVSSAFTASTLLGALLMGLLALASLPLPHFYNEPRLREVLLWMSAIFLMKGVCSTPRDLMRRQLKFWPFMVASALAVSISGIFGIVIAVRGSGIHALIAYNLGEAGIACVVSLALAIKTGAWKPSFGIYRKEFREISRFGLFVSGQRLVFYGQTNSDNLIVGKKLGAQALGYYGLAYQLMLYPIIRVADVVGQVAFPAFSSIQHDVSRLRAAFLRGIQNIAIVCFPISVGTAISAPVLVPVLLGDRWHPAVLPIQILAISGIRLSINRLGGAIYQATGRPQWDFYFSGIMLVFIVIGFLVGVQHGIVGVAWSYTIVGYAGWPISQRMATKAVQADGWAMMKAVAPIAAATTVMGVLTEGTYLLLRDRVADPITLAALIMVGGFSYLAGLQIFAKGLLKRLISDFTKRK